MSNNGSVVPDADNQIIEKNQVFGSIKDSLVNLIILVTSSNNPDGKIFLDFLFSLSFFLLLNSKHMLIKKSYDAIIFEEPIRSILLHNIRVDWNLLHYEFNNGCHLQSI